MSEDASTHAEIPRTAWLALAVTTLAFFLIVVDVSAVNVAFPSIRESFDVSDGALSWIISGYSIVVATGLLLAGRLADSIGRKRVFLPGVAVFLVGSLLCGLAPSVWTLIGARVVQAVGGAVVSASSLAVVLPAFPPHRRGSVIGIAGATGALGAVAGPAVGSVLIDLFNWRAIFLINVPICVLILVLGPRLLQESKDPGATGRIDPFGVPVGTAAIALIMFAIVQSESWGVGDWRVLVIAAVGLLLLPVLVWRSARHPEPLLDLTLFRLPAFRSTNLGVAFYSAAFTSGFLVNSLLLQDLWGQSITTTGLALIPSPVLATIVSPVAGRFSDRFGHRWLLGVGSMLCATSFLLYRLLLDETPTVGSRFIPISLILGVGVGSTIASWSSAGLADIQPAKFGVAGATIRTVQQCFYALGIAVVVTLLAAGTDRADLVGYHWAWVWVAVCYAASGAVIMTTFPSGSAKERLS